MVDWQVEVLSTTKLKATAFFLKTKRLYQTLKIMSLWQMLNMIFVFEVEDSDYFSNKTYVFCLFSSAMSPRSQKTLKEGF